MAQDDEQDWKLYRPGNDSSVNAVKKTAGTQTAFVLTGTGKEGNVQVIKDARIEPLTSFVGSPQNGNINVTLKGYRIQASLDRDKNKVNQLRAEYLSRFEDQPAYIDFLAPNFRLRVGDFRTKLDAYCYLEKIKAIFPDAIIVMDDIELPKYD